MTSSYSARLAHSRRFSHRPLPLPAPLLVLGLAPSAQRPPCASSPSLRGWVSVSSSRDVFFPLTPLVCLRLSCPPVPPPTLPSPPALRPACPHWGRPESPPSVMPRPRPASTGSPARTTSPGRLKQAVFPEHGGLENSTSLRAPWAPSPGRVCSDFSHPRAGPSSAGAIAADTGAAGPPGAFGAGPVAARALVTPFLASGLRVSGAGWRPRACVTRGKLAGCHLSCTGSGARGLGSERSRRGGAVSGGWSSWPDSDVVPGNARCW